MADATTWLVGKSLTVRHHIFLQLVYYYYHTVYFSASDFSRLASVAIFSASLSDDDLLLKLALALVIGRFFSYLQLILG